MQRVIYIMGRLVKMNNMAILKYIQIMSYFQLLKVKERINKTVKVKTVEIKNHIDYYK